MKNSRIFTFGLLTIASVAAVFALASMVFSATAHAAYYYDGAPLTVSCYPNPVTAELGQSVTWYANVTGGIGNYTFSWNGDESLFSSVSSAIKAYSFTGNKYATVHVTSGNQTVSSPCTNTVSVVSHSMYNDPYSYGSNYYNTYPTPNIQGSCSANITTGPVGTQVVWNANVYGGTGIYSYAWSGSEAISGYGPATAVTYYSPGIKNAVVTVTSSGQMKTLYCTNTVNITGVYGNSYYGSTYNNLYGTNYNGYMTGYNSNNFTYSTSANGGLDVGCFVDPGSASVNQPVTWNAEVSGGSGQYTYSWTGTDGLSGTQASALKSYTTAGEKNAVVSVSSSDGKTGIRACSNPLTVRGYNGGSNIAQPQQINPVQNIQNQNGQNPNQNSNQNQNGLSASSLTSFGTIPWGWIAALIILVLLFTVIYLLLHRQRM